VKEGTSLSTHLNSPQSDPAPLFTQGSMPPHPTPTRAPTAPCTAPIPILIPLGCHCLGTMAWHGPGLSLLLLCP
jgi:hypothetical protein